uniref:Uncharacterized protein n=1 Tax=Bosea sp. NBC_00436 TaxID=2969620 RepID=A0A9E8CTK6_9HYPH
MTSEFDTWRAETDIELLGNFVVPRLKLCMEVGWADILESTLKDRALKNLNAADRPDIFEVVQQAKGWLAETRAIEAVDGNDCRLNVSHPAYIEAMNYFKNKPKSSSHPIRRARKIQSSLS